MRLVRVYTGPFAIAQCARIEAEGIALGDLMQDQQLIAQLWPPPTTVATLGGVSVLAIRPNSLLGSVRRLRAVVEEHDPEVMYCHGVWSLLVTAIARLGRRNASSVVYEIHGAAAFEALHSGKRFTPLRFVALYALESLACLLADRIVLVSEAYVTYYPTARMKPRFTVPRLISGLNNAVVPDHISVFVNRARRERRSIVVYSGSAARYQLPVETVTFMRRLVDEKGFAALVLSQDRDTFDQILMRGGGMTDRWLITSVSREEVQPALRLCDLGVLLRSNTVLNKVASPTKLYEYFAAGLSVATTAVIGEAESIIARTGGGVVFGNVEEAVYAVDASQRCVAAVGRASQREGSSATFIWKPDRRFSDFVMVSAAPPQRVV